MKKYNGLIDFYRFLFSIIIVSHHAIWLGGRNEGDVTHFVPFEGGYIIVEFFYILSGFLLSQSAWKKENTDKKEIALDTVNEIKKRAIHMYYYFIPAFMVAFFVISWSGYLQNSQSISDIFLELAESIWEILFLQMSGIGGRTIFYIGPMWYFSAMLVGILVIYPLLRRYRECFFAVIAPLAVLVCYGYHSKLYGGIYTIVEWNGFLYSGVIRAIGDLCLGCICFFISHSTKEKVEYDEKKHYWGVAILELLLLTLSLYLMNTYHTSQIDFIVVFIFFIIIFLAFTRESFLNRIFDNRVCVFLGKYSVSVYVAHEVLLKIPTSLFSREWHYHYLQYMIVAILLASINYTIANLLMKRLGKGLVRMGGGSNGILLYSCGKGCFCPGLFFCMP